jgi:hypothetical protein
MRRLVVATKANAPTARSLGRLMLPQPRLSVVFERHFNIIQPNWTDAAWQHFDRLVSADHSSVAGRLWAEASFQVLNSRMFLVVAKVVPGCT